MTTDKYILIGQTPVPCPDILEWARWFEDNENRRVFRTRILEMVEVSTVFLGVGRGLGRRPILFESMAFWDGEYGAETDRCSTWSEAEAMHAAMCRKVMRPARVLAYFLRYFRNWWQGAKHQWRLAWMDLQGVEPSQFDRMRGRIEDRW
jgi:hypothetical protein